MTQEEIKEKVSDIQSLIRTHEQIAQEFDGWFIKTKGRELEEELKTWKHKLNSVDFIINEGKKDMTTVVVSFEALLRGVAPCGNGDGYILSNDEMTQLNDIFNGEDIEFVPASWE